MPMLNGRPVDALNPNDVSPTELGEANDANAEPASLGANPFSLRHTSAPRISAPASKMRRTSTPSSGAPQDENPNLPAIPTPIEWGEVEKYFKR
jgi:hypothetical protein